MYEGCTPLKIPRRAQYSISEMSADSRKSLSSPDRRRLEWCIKSAGLVLKGSADSTAGECRALRGERLGAFRGAFRGALRTPAWLHNLRQDCVPSGRFGALRLDSVLHGDALIAAATLTSQRESRPVRCLCL